MGWTLDPTGRIWRCSSYTDLDYATLMNLAEYGQPKSPYELGYDYNFEERTDFKNVIIEMPQHEVMTYGFGRRITPYSFPIVNRFLNNNFTLVCGSYSFDDLVSRKIAQPSDRIITADLYTNAGGIDSGAIGPIEAAHIYGNVAFALRSTSRFIYTPQVRRVDAEIGAMDDNWDYSSSNKFVHYIVNPLLAALFPPDHYNLEGPIRIQFRGPGKRASVARNNIGSSQCERTKSSRTDLP